MGLEYMLVDAEQYMAYYPQVCLLLVLTTVQKQFDETSANFWSKIRKNFIEINIRQRSNVFLSSNFFSGHVEYGFDNPVDFFVGTLKSSSSKFEHSYENVELEKVITLLENVHMDMLGTVFRNPPENFCRFSQKKV